MNINDFKNRKCFTTPDGYFEELNRGIKEATCKSVINVPKKRKLTQRLTAIMGYAAMIAIVATVAASILLKSPQSGSVENLTATAESVYDGDFIDNMLTSYPIDEYTLYCYLTGCE